LSRAPFLSLVWIGAALVLFPTFGCGRKPLAPTPPPLDFEELSRALVGRAVAFSSDGSIRSRGASVGYAESRIMVDPALGMRIDAFSPFMTHLFSFVVAGGSAQYLNVRERLLVRGDPETVLSRLFDLRVDPSPLPWILAGGIPPSKKGWHYVPVAAGEPPGALVLETVDGKGGRFRAVLEGPERRLTMFRSFRDDESQRGERAVVECSRHAGDGVPIPKKVVLRSPGTDGSLTIRLGDIEVGRGPTLDDLTIPPKPGTKIFDL